MLAKKGSIDGYNIRQKTSDIVGYVKNNFWKVLPLGSSINYIKNGKKKNATKDLFHDAYATVGILGLVIWLTGGVFLGAWTPKQIKQYNEKVRIELELKIQDIDETNYRNNRLLENAKNFEDSLEIYKKYHYPIILLEPSIEQKKRAIEQNEREMTVKQNELEKGLR